MSIASDRYRLLPHELRPREKDEEWYEWPVKPSSMEMWCRKRGPFFLCIVNLLSINIALLHVPMNGIECEAQCFLLLVLLMSFTSPWAGNRYSSFENSHAHRINSAILRELKVYANSDVVRNAARFMGKTTIADWLDDVHVAQTAAFDNRKHEFLLYKFLFSPFFRFVLFPLRLA